MSESTNRSEARLDEVVAVSSAPLAPPRPPPPAEDVEVLAMIARGAHRDAVIALMRLHGDAVYAFSLRMVRDRERAADVQQQVFLEAHRDLATFSGRSALRTWLFSIARHRSLDAIKSHVVHGGDRHVPEAALATVARSEAAIEDRIDQARLAPALEECLGRLTDKAREAVLMRYVHDVSYEEMAVLLDEKANTLQARVARAFPALRECLERKGLTP